MLAIGVFDVIDAEPISGSTGNEKTEDCEAELKSLRRS